MNWVAQKKEHVLHAFTVLDDATDAMIKWSWGPIDPGSESRIVYTAAVTLLRAVGHVLHKVDCEKFPEIKPMVADRYKNWKKGEGSDVIFTEFIEAERNNVIKEYELLWDEKNKRSFKFQAYKNPFVNDEGKLDGELYSTREIEAIVVPDGKLAGYYIDELLFAAGNWWHKELDEIEKLITRK